MEKSVGILENQINDLLKGSSAMKSGNFPWYMIYIFIFVFVFQVQYGNRS